MQRFLIPLFVLAILLSACGGGAVAVECASDYWDGAVGACLPKGWSVLDKETLKERGVPEETIAAFRREESVSGQFPTVTVTSEVLASAVPPAAADYSSSSIRAVSVLPGYSVIETPPMDIDGQEVSLHVFSAQPVPDEPARRFYQASSVKGNIGYTITAAAPVFAEKELDGEIRLIFENVTFEKAEEE